MSLHQSIGQNLQAKFMTNSVKVFNKSSKVVSYINVLDLSGLFCPI